jgi:hypothetical protein
MRALIASILGVLLAANGIAMLVVPGRMVRGGSRRHPHGSAQLPFRSRYR